MDADLRDELRRRPALVNPEPCDPDICGILGVPCPRCQAEFVEAWIQDEITKHDVEFSKAHPVPNKR